MGSDHTRQSDTAHTVQRIQDESRERRRSAQEHIDQSAEKLARGVDRDGLDDRGRGVEIELLHGVQVISSWTAPGWREPDDTYIVASTIYVTTGYAQPYERDGRKVYQVWVRPRGQYRPGSPS